MTDTQDGALVQSTAVTVPNGAAQNDLAVARETVRQGAEVLRRFVFMLSDMGIQAQMLEVLSYALPGRNDDTPKAIFSQAVNDVVEVDLFGGIGEFDGKKVIEGAASLELLVRYARMLSAPRPQVLPVEHIPSPALVDAYR